MKINEDKKSVSLDINWEVFGPLTTASAWANEMQTYQIIGFTKTIKEAFIGEFGQDSIGITLLFIMEDGSVEYMPMFIQKIDGQGNKYYAMNYTYEYSKDNRVTGTHFESKGAILGISDVIKLYNADVGTTNGPGYRTAIAALKDGSFYDLGKNITK